MTGRGYGLIIDRKTMQKNYGTIHRHTRNNCNIKTYYIANCDVLGRAICSVCGKHWSI